MSEPTPEPQPSSAENRGPARAAALDSNQKPPAAPAGKRVASALLGNDTRTGRAMRAFLRGLAAVVGFFALGLLTAYLLLFRPAMSQLQAARADLASTQSQLQEKQVQLDRAALTFAAAEVERKQAVADLAKASARLDVQQMLVSVSGARLAVAKKDLSAARLALGELETRLKAALPGLQSLAGAQPDTLQKLLDLAKNDLGRDFSLADQDLQRLVSELMLLDQALLK